ncbi:MAG: DNA-directed RNA polymerase subunit delta [Bacilli bacterium]
MKFITFTKEEAETMPFDDLAYLILKEKKKKMKTNDLFKTICELLNYDNNEYEEKVGDFYTLLLTEKRFLQLNNGYWDLKENHQAKIIKDDDEELLEDTLNIRMDEEDGEEDENLYNEILDMEDEEVEDDLKDLVLVDEEDIEEIN